ncbi:MAG: SH3 domain-containing protein [Thermodesulfobacteriota bacterium]
MRRQALFAAGMAVLLVLVASLAASAEERLSISVPTANVRTGPGTDYEKSWMVEKYYPIIVLERKDRWIKFKDYEGDEGWIRDDLVSSTSTVIVKKPRVNVRSGPGTHHKVAFGVEKGVPLKVKSAQGDWIQVSHADGDTGWILKTLVW